MRLFHYHFWTDKAEAMERFYRSREFRTALRIGRENGEMRTYNPPLDWEDFRHRGIRFRIIEMIRGHVNVTFGDGTRDRLDHLGVLVDEEEHDAVANRARQSGMQVKESDARTFVQTPWGFRLELQRRRDVVDVEPKAVIAGMKMRIPFSPDPRMLAEWLKAEAAEEAGEVTLMRDGWRLQFAEGDRPCLDTVHLITPDPPSESVDPTGVRIIETPQ